MGLRKLFYISLAAKCQMLFSVAVVVIIIAALLVPWVYMGSLVSELNANLAKQAALTIQSQYPLHAANWSDVQTDIDEFWPAIARELGLTARAPKLVYVGGCGQEAHADWDDFERDDILHMCGIPQEFGAQRTVQAPGRGPLTR